MTLYNEAAAYIAAKESFRGEAYWDVNAWRIGYGSDTRTAAQIPVKKGDLETRADAAENLAVRLQEFFAVCVKDAGQNFAHLPRDAQIGLLSMCYNYGHLPANVASAITRDLPLIQIANAVRAHENDHPISNKARRADEARMIDGRKV